ncbi:MAG: SDR family oxidoreductase [Acidisphaera sp.]|nr:SDR family oxidoreductase [Acidisphaera sp.]
MDARLAGKSVLVVGAGASAPGWGIGRAVTAQFVREGARVLAVDVEPDRLEETARLIADEGGACQTAVADSLSLPDMERAVQGCVAAFGRIDVLQHNVGGGGPGGVLETSEAEWRRLIDLNLTSAFIVAKAALPAMLDAGGAITFISSVAAFRPVAGSSPAYHAAKAGVVQLARVIALQHAAQGVRVNCILPGYVDTPEMRRRHAARFGAGRVEEIMQRRAATIPSGRAASVWDIAHAAVFLASDEARQISGTEIVIDGTQTLQSAPPYLPPG